jgi:site-specific DNA recombinase
VLTDSGRRTAPASLKIKYLLTGLILCGKCGDKMYACPAENPRRMIYRCLKTHLARGLRDVDEVVEAAVIARLSRSDAADLFAPDVDLDALRARVTELRERRDGLAGLLADGLLSPAVVRR